MHQLFLPQGIPYSILLLSLVGIAGLALGSLKIRGVGLGLSAVLFVGILAGHFGAKLDPVALHFARDCGLVLFVYAIGTQAGPGLIASLRKSGLKLNSLALMTLLLGCAVTVGIGRLLHVETPSLVGVYSGAVTNTPSLAAAQQVLMTLSPGGAEQAALGYAIAYPGGVFGIIVSMLLARLLFRARGVSTTSEPAPTADQPVGSVKVRVTKSEWAGRSLAEALQPFEGALTVPLRYNEGNITPAKADSILHQGDVLLAIGELQQLEQFTEQVGAASATDLRPGNSDLTVRRLIVTKRAAQRPIGDALTELTGAVATRVLRGGLEITPSPGLVLQFGDVVQVVGDEQGIAKATELLGNTTHQLDHPQLIPVMLGLAAGVILGSIPISIPGVPVPVTLGLAGGPLIAALVLSSIGRIGRVVWYLPQSANFMLRELGMVVFLACVGIKSGEHFIETLLSSSGVHFIISGILITVLPLLVLAVASLMVRLDFMTTCGLLAGSMTDPPALAFSSAFGQVDKAYVSYAAVYPLMMILRVVSAQLLVAWG